ncbi:MAG TPA: endolytic transglycosylase MltG [Alphaproteobacteria bacterium]|nr:endolytic transglycosylase MltG [Alphaproteobacteria bacterium]
MKKTILLAFLGTIALFLAFLAGGVSYWFQHPLKNKSTIVLIEKGASLSNISSLLHENKVLQFSFLFKSTLYLTGGWRHLKAGEYLIPPSVTPAQLIHILKSGNVIFHPVALIEGETSHHFTQKLLKDNRFQGVCEVPAEGSLLPETYHFPRNAARQEIIKHMQKSMGVALLNIWLGRSHDLPLQSPEELLVLASIVEKETALPHERPYVAAVFLNRLRQGMRLQADPTLIYGLSQGKEETIRELTLKDLQTENPYNTYLNSGLPPSPISNPSLASLRAVAHPENVSYIYFVADGSGGHVFATTLEEHQKNHAQWRKIRKQD